ncbi:MAG: isoleucine--tRNA ligase [Lentisphaeria bacterium]|nr:isoleucine--tRNA ligase [Lentisphaeria bacterium]MDY0176122.1 isoleucine--tRNA ligase [Lentisphaeria bacterium]NLZ60448.1 isoleucine--tRNA ligase [Lentisphaerota bacterium]
MFEAVEGSASLAQLEQQVLDFWEKEDIFVKSMERRREGKAYVFYDGPPFATGLPHYGHLLAGTIKDVVPRYQTMRGRYVERTFGWDCHGLPIESLAQSALGLAGAPAIKACGIERFNEQCRSMVLTYVKEWETTVKRLGRWVDFENGYKTMDPTFMESIWWVFQQLWKQGRIYKAHRIMPYSWKLNTPLSNFEANSNYQDVQDPSLSIRIKMLSLPPGLELPDEIQCYLLIWTTTPWTLPSNLAVCVGPDIDYCLVRDADSQAAYLLAKARLEAYYKEESQYELLAEFKGSELVGLKYEPIFDYFAKQRPNAFRVLADDFVSTADGSGIVHMAPAYGEDDYRVCRANDIELVDPLDEDGNFTDEVPDFAGQLCKDADKEIIRLLKAQGKLVHHSTIVHSYPFCERTDTPLIYRAIEAWYVRVEDMHERLLKSNSQIKWMPEYVGEKRFANWLAEAKDWNISRNRFWGSCIPLWINVEDENDIICVGSVAELEELSGCKVSDLHKQFIDRIEIRRDGKLYRRTPEVLDCWFESGSMPYAQHHYPFANKEKVEKAFPAEFIAEGLDQTRGWFYTLIVISTALFDQPAFTNVVVNGLVLAEDGRKMSKRLQNYPDPMQVINSYGADALRLCLLGSPVVRAEDLRFSESAVREVMRSVLLPLWNAYSFLVTYARLDQWRPADALRTAPQQPAHVLDRWILSRLASITIDMRQAMDSYDLQKGATRFTAFIEDLTNWYIRRSRRRFWKSSNDSDKDEAYQTLYHVLLSFCKLACPFIPFITENIYRNLRSEQMPESVHLCDYPEASAQDCDQELNLCMSRTMRAVSLGRYLRSQTGLKIRQPLARVLLVSADAAVRRDLESMSEIIAEELNVKELLLQADEQELVRLSALPNLKKLGPKYGRRLKELGALISALSGTQVSALLNGEELMLELSDGESLSLSLDDILVQRQEREGLTVANEDDITVALDTRLDEALISEGWARELVSKLQGLRKELQFEVSDRIHIEFYGPEEVQEAVKTQGEYIAAETLALSLKPSQKPCRHEVEMNGLKASFNLEKA